MAEWLKLLVFVLRSLFKSRARLEAENLVLRQELDGEIRDLIRQVSMANRCGARRAFTASYSRSASRLPSRPSPNTRCRAPVCGELFIFKQNQQFAIDSLPRLETVRHLRLPASLSPGD